MTDALFDELIAAREARKPCALVTVAATCGSVPRAAGSKMLVYADGTFSSTIGGGKFEALVIEDAAKAMQAKQPLLKTYPLHETSSESFGAICGGEVTLLIEPQLLSESLFLVGGGHCAQAIAKWAIECGLFITVIEDRSEVTANLPRPVVTVRDKDAPEFIRGREWKSDEAIIMVSRNYELDREALAAALEITGAGYIGMIGSNRKVQRVYDELRKRGVSEENLKRVYAPLGLDIGADAPAEIAVSVLAEVLAVLRGKSGKNLKSFPKSG
jgi:xanthine dehydrogenase accessory factor